MIVFSSEPHAGALVVGLDGALDPGGPELLAGHLHGLPFRGPLVLDVTGLALGEPELSEVLGRLERGPLAGRLAVVHDDLAARRTLRSWTTLPVLPSVEEALHGHTATALDRPVVGGDPAPARSATIR